MAVFPETKIQVRPGRVACATHITNGLALLNPHTLGHTAGIPGEMVVTSDVQAVVTDLNIITGTLGITLVDHLPVANGMNGCTGRGGIINAPVGPAIMQNGMHPAQRVPGTDTGKTQRGLQKLTTQTIPFQIIKIQGAVLLKRNGIVPLPFVLKISRMDIADADRGAVNIFFFIDHFEVIAPVQTKKIDGPGINLR